MNKPLVTVVIPLHNYGQYVTETIRSIQAQTLNNIEVFIINDASEDDSEAVARKAIEGDARFHVMNANFRNLSATRNYGISQGSAPFICCIDSDDRLGNPDFLEVLVTELEKDRTLGIAFTSLTVMDTEGKLGHTPLWPNGFDADGQYKRLNQLPTCNVFRREAWRRAGGYRPFYHMVEDAELWTTIIDIGYGAIHAVRDGWFHYRLHNKSASQVHRTGEVPEPDWLEFHPWAKDGQRPLAAGGIPPRGSWPVRFYNEPDVSIIIPVGVGHEEAVKDALHSVEGQTHRYWECIVIDDTPENRLRGHLTGFEWVKLYTTKGAQGAGVARNVGLQRAQAPFVVFLDADDMLKPDFLTETLKAYRHNGKYAYTDWLTHDRMTNWQVHETPNYSFEAVKERPSLHPITALIPRRWALDVGGFDERMPAFEDTDFFMKLFVKGYCGIRVPKPLLIYNLDSGTRRKVSNDYRDTFHQLLKKRYGAYMEEKTMCCVQPPKGKAAVAPTLENAAEYKETYGDMVLAQLTGRFVAEAPIEFRGPATRAYYGRRAKGDIFYIWQADLEQSDDTFTAVNNYTTEPEPTVVPPEPPSVPTLAPESLPSVQEFTTEQIEAVAEMFGIPDTIIDDGAAEPQVSYAELQAQKASKSTQVTPKRSKRGKKK